MKPVAAIVGLSALCALPALAGTDPVPAAVALLQAEPAPVLAKVESREFLYNRGLSNQGALAVERVRYQLEVLDPRGDTNLAQGNRIQVELPGGCASLLQPQASYLLALKASAGGWVADCTVRNPAAPVEAALVSH